MYTHAPENYDCPICRVVQGHFTPTQPVTRPEDVILQTPLATAFISARWWPNNSGHVLVVPNKHFENIYDLPANYVADIHTLAQNIALAFKEVYKCDGVSTR
jgi:histidine triad (HIT) family protein